MSFQLAKYIEPDFTKEMFVNAPNARLIKAPCAKAAPKGFHATSIFPEYFKIDGKNYKMDKKVRNCRGLVNELMSIVDEDKIKFFKA